MLKLINAHGRQESKGAADLNRDHFEKQMQALDQKGEVYLFPRQL